MVWSFSSHLFLFCSIAVIIFLDVLLICAIFNKKVSKWFYISIWGALLVLILIFYNDVVFNIVDNLFDNVFMAIYFPNLAVYIVVLLISNSFFFYSAFSKKIDKHHKMLNIISSVVLNIFLIFIVTIVKQNNINVYERLTVYSNPYLLVLLEVSMGVFLAWILLNLLISAHNKLKAYDKKDLPPMPEIVFEDTK